MARITPFKISKEAVAEEKKVAKRKRETSAKKGEPRAAPQLQPKKPCYALP